MSGTAANADRSNDL